MKQTERDNAIDKAIKNLESFKPKKLIPADNKKVGEAMREALIAQAVTGLIAMPHMLDRLEDMASNGDEFAEEVLARYENLEKY